MMNKESLERHEDLRLIEARAAVAGSEDVRYVDSEDFDYLISEVIKLRAQVENLCARVAAQSELLTKRAEKGYVFD